MLIGLELAFVIIEGIESTKSQSEYINISVFGKHILFIVTYVSKLKI